MKKFLFLPLTLLLVAHLHAQDAAQAEAPVVQRADNAATHRSTQEESTVHDAQKAVLAAVAEAVATQNDGIKRDVDYAKVKEIAGRPKGHDVAVVQNEQVQDNK